MGMIEFDQYEKSALRKEAYLETYDSLKNEFKESNPDFNYEAFLQKGEEYFENYLSKRMKKMKKEGKSNSESNINDIEDDFGPIQINQIPYFYGSHYSNPTYVSHYLARIFPFSFISIEIQGDKFDDPDRLFTSISKTFESACTLKDDVRELIPEFYYLSEIFLNKNNLNLSQGKVDSEGKEREINDVILPPWSLESPAVFTTKMRLFLENFGDKININKWIDLIFGSYQRGEKSEEAHNIFMAQTYEKIIKIEDIVEPDYRNTLMRLNEVGVTPFKILFNDSKPRLDRNIFLQKNMVYSFNKGSFLYDCKTLETIILKTKTLKKLFKNNKKEKNISPTQDVVKCPKIINIKCIDNETLKIFLNINKWYDIKYTINEVGVIGNDSELHYYENNSSKFTSKYQINSLNNNPVIIYGKSKYIVKGGFWDGRLEFNSIPSDQKDKTISSFIFSKYNKPIVVMEMSPDEKLLICGTISGLIQIFEVDGEKINNIENLHLHSDEITSISINNNLNMFATVSKDGYLHLYILPSFNLVRAIKLSSVTNKKKDHIKEKEIKNEKGNEKEKEEGEIKENNEPKSVEKEEENNKEKEENKKEETQKEENKKEETQKEEIKKEDNEIIENNNNEQKENENENIIEKENIQEKSSNLINTDENQKEKKDSINEINNNIINNENKNEISSNEEEDIYADNVFLSSSPLPCVTVYISKKRLFRTYTINGEFMCEEKEEDELNSQYIKSPILFKNLLLQDFIIYGTDKGFVKIRAFPEMNIIGNILKVTPEVSIETLAISNDKRICYTWSEGNEINIIKDKSVSFIQASENITRMGFNI